MAKEEILDQDKLTLERLKIMTLSEKQARLIRVICDSQTTDEQIERLLAAAEGIEIGETVDQIIARHQPGDRLILLKQAKGIWKDRHDLPAFEEIRAEWNRFN